MGCVSPSRDGETNRCSNAEAKANTRHRNWRRRGLITTSIPLAAAIPWHSSLGEILFRTRAFPHSTDSVIPVMNSEQVVIQSLKDTFTASYWNIENKIMDFAGIAAILKAMSLHLFSQPQCKGKLVLFLQARVEGRTPPPPHIQECCSTWDWSWSQSHFLKVSVSSWTLRNLYSVLSWSPTKLVTLS